MAQVALISHPDCSRHDTGWRHPEHQGRLRGLMAAVYRALPDLLPGVESVEAHPADPTALELAHTAEHIETVRAAVARARETESLVHLDGDTVVGEASWNAALAAVGCVLEGIEGVVGGDHRSAFCAVRPPGHHATSDRAMGFCLFNAVAVGTRAAISGGLVARPLIVDWDVHHGNGTEAIFREDPDVFYLSMHQSPLYPGTGARDDRGTGPGEGATLNIPLPPGLAPEQYVDALLHGLDRALEVFEPDLVLVSAGFDAAAGDPLAGFTLEPEHFRRLTLELVRRTRASATGRVVSVLEGGYDPDELGRCAVAHLEALCDADV